MHNMCMQTFEKTENIEISVQEKLEKTYEELPGICDTLAKTEPLRPSERDNLTRREALEQLAKSLLPIREYFGIKSSWSDETILREVDFTKSYDLSPDIVIFDKYGSNPCAIELRRPDEKTEFSIALMKQDKDKGVKFCFNAELMPNGNILPNKDIGLIEFFEKGRESYQIGVDNTGKVLFMIKMEYPTDDKDFQFMGSAIPARERLRIFHNHKVETETGPENDPQAKENKMDYEGKIDLVKFMQNLKDGSNKEINIEDYLNIAV